jgi:hypothetical protein
VDRVFSSRPIKIAFYHAAPNIGSVFSVALMLERLNPSSLLTLTRIKGAIRARPAAPIGLS